MILIYDQLITLSDEVEHVWKRKWTGATLLFFLNRYATLFKTIVGFAINWASSVRVSSIVTYTNDRN